MKSHRTINRTLALILLFLLAAAPAPAATRLPTLGYAPAAMVHPASGDSGLADFALHIPAIEVDVPVEEAWIVGTTWDFSGFTGQAGHFELTGYPGMGGNVVIGAHYELAGFVPGPFYRLDQVAVGTQLSLDYQGMTYVYEVTEAFTVDPSEIGVVMPTAQETLTLMTCYAYNAGGGSYDQRYVVQALLVAVL